MITLSNDTSVRGLSTKEVEDRLRTEGYNELPSTTQRSTLAIALGVAREPMFLLLIVSVVIYLTLGDVREAAILSVSLFVIFGITTFQERKTERALEALRDLSSPRALVIRDGVEIVDPRPNAIGSLAEVFRNYPWVGRALPAMGYSRAQLGDLAATIENTPCDSTVVATPVDLARLIQLPKPHCRVRYDLEEMSYPDLAECIATFVQAQAHRLPC